MKQNNQNHPLSGLQDFTEEQSVPSEPSEKIRDSDKKQGWSKKSLMEIASISTGKWDANHANENGEYRFYTCAYDYLYCDTKRFEGECLILPGNGVNVGEVFYYNGEFDAYQRTYVISDIKILPKYLHYHMLLHWKAIGTRQQYGSATNFIKIGNFKEYEVQYPPLPEQQRIVSILDECFAAIDKAKANAEQNLKNTKELFESYLENVFTEIYNSNETKTISELAKVIGGYSFNSADFKKEGRYQIIRMGNVRPGIIRENESPVFINELNEKALAKALLRRNDVIITQTGTKKKRDYGFTVTIEKDNYLLNQRIAAIRFSEKYLPKFFLYFSWTNLFKDQYFANETGTVGQGNVGIGAITDAKVPFIKIKKQEEIISKIDVILSETERLGNSYQKKLNDLEELKKSILQKAFAGELRTSDSIWLYRSESQKPIELAADPNTKY